MWIEVELLFRKRNHPNKKKKKMEKSMIHTIGNLLWVHTAKWNWMALYWWAQLGWRCMWSTGIACTEQWITITDKYSIIVCLKWKTKRNERKWIKQKPKHNQHTNIKRRQIKYFIMLFWSMRHVFIVAQSHTSNQTRNGNGMCWASTKQQQQKTKTKPIPILLAIALPEQ